MASNENTPLNIPGGPTFTQRLFSEEVAIARAEGGEVMEQARETAYVFSNGRKFVEPYRPG